MKEEMLVLYPAGVRLALHREVSWHSPDPFESQPMPAMRYEHEQHENLYRSAGWKRKSRWVSDWEDDE